LDHECVFVLQVLHRDLRIRRSVSEVITLRSSSGDVSVVRFGLSRMQYPWVAACFAASTAASQKVAAGAESRSSVSRNPLRLRAMQAAKDITFGRFRLDLANEWLWQ